MSQEDKELLLKDLSARLPYGVVVVLDEKFGFNKGTRPLVKELLDLYCVEGMKPYLRPMESMTEEEDNEWNGLNIDPLLEAVKERHTRIEDLMLRAKSQYKPIDWLNAHHFDYRGLIEKSLAIAVTKENKPYENNNN